jgi:hypothetical protein
MFSKLEFLYCFEVSFILNHQKGLLEFCAALKVQLFCIRFIVNNKCCVIDSWQVLYFIYVIAIG